MGTGSVLVLPEVLSKPMPADEASAETQSLISLLSRIDLRPVDAATSRLALALAVAHGLRAVDAAHPATAVAGGADRFLMNNRKVFSRAISGIEMIYPEDLPAP